MFHSNPFYWLENKAQRNLIISQHHQGDMWGAQICVGGIGHSNKEKTVLITVLCNIYPIQRNK